jgi:hypothetical protein
MHIKTITVSNFRSFKQQPDIHPFSPEMNCVVGRNGSGKSNLFDAVQFVLGCPKFWSLRTVRHPNYCFILFIYLEGGIIYVTRLCVWWERGGGRRSLGPPYLDARHCFWQITYTIKERRALQWMMDALERGIDTMIRFA